MDIAKVAVIGVMGVLMAVQLKEQKSSIAYYVSLAVVLLLAALLLDKMGIIMELLSRVEQLIPIPRAYIRALLKIVGITYIADFGAAICKDAGHEAISHQITIFGKISILAISMPILLTLLETIEELM